MAAERTKDRIVLSGNRTPADLPDQAGVYLMRGEKGTVLYVGKAKNLKKRVASYFLKSRHLDPKTRALVGRIATVETIVTRTEKEALLLESNLIKRHRPRYNVVLKDDKRYPALRLDLRHPFPNLTIVRKIQKDGALYFGPFASAHAVRETLKVVNRTFKLRKCKNREFANRTRPCLHHQMGACLGPCVGLVDPGTYAEMVAEVVLFLKGRTPELIEKIRGEMAAAVAEEAFERAAVLRDKMFALEKTLEHQGVVSADLKDRDVFALARSSEAAVVTLQTVRGGYLQGSRNFPFRETLESDAGFMAAFLRQYYESAAFVPGEVLVTHEPEDPELLQEWLRTRLGVRLTVRRPRRGAKRKLVEAALRNAEEALAAHEAATAGRQGMLLRLKERLGLERIPEWIECYDNSNLAGDALVGARVVFRDAEPAKAHYRTYRIDDISVPDDYAAMAQVLRRRFGKADPDPMPDLLVVDGGRGQLGIAVAVLRDLSLSGRFGVAGIAKKDADRGESEDKIYLPGRSNPVNLSRDPDLLLLLQRIRDEAHRFAVTTHRKRRSRGFLASELDGVPGVGPKRKALLLAHFGSLRRIREASVEALAALPGIDAKTAEAIREALGPGAATD
jgi:excinuclease ABC subunit C